MIQVLPGDEDSNWEKWETRNKLQVDIRGQPRIIAPRIVLSDYS